MGKNNDLKQKFWSTRDPGQTPFTFQIGMGKVIKAWDEGGEQIIFPPPVYICVSRMGLCMYVQEVTRSDNNRSWRELSDDDEAR